MDAGRALIGCSAGSTVLRTEGTGVDDSTSALLESAGPADESVGRTIAYVTETGIETLAEDGGITAVECATGRTVDWSPDHTCVAMLYYHRTDMAYAEGSSW